LSFDLQDEASRKSLVQERQALLASAFRKLMTSDTSFQCHNEYRQYFYKEVIELADAVTFIALHLVFLKTTDFSGLRVVK
jgi:hypothetical protein